MALKERAKRLKSDVPAVFLALKDSRTPLSAKIFAALTVAYALSPIDLIPDFIPVLGYLDDLLILPALAAAAIHFIPKDVMEECRRKSEGMWENGKPKKGYFAVPIVVFWIIILMLILIPHSAL